MGGGMTDSPDEGEVLVDSSPTGVSAVGRWVSQKMSEGRRRGGVRSSGCDVVVPSASYRLGMRTRGELRKRLALDLPRSLVTMRGCRVTSAGERDAEGLERSHMHAGRPRPSVGMDPAPRHPRPRVGRGGAGEGKRKAV